MKYIDNPTDAIPQEIEYNEERSNQVKIPNSETIKAMQDVRDGIGLEEITIQQLQQEIEIIKYVESNNTKSVPNVQSEITRYTNMAQKHIGIK